MALGANNHKGHAGRLEAMRNVGLNRKPFSRSHLRPKSKLFYNIVNAPQDSTAADGQNAIGDIVIDVTGTSSNHNPNAIVVGVHASIANNDWTQINPT